MNNEIRYISIREVASRLTRHPLMVDLTLESVVQYTVDFIGIVGFKSLFTNRIDTVTIRNYRAKLPCYVVSIQQVKENKSGVSLRSTTDSYFLSPKREQGSKEEMTFKTQGNIIYTSFKEGEITVAYNTILEDDDGFPLLIDNSKFLKALELYIKQEMFTILFDMGKITAPVLNNVQQDYAWRVGQLTSEFTIPSMSEMESISNMLNQLIPRTNEFRKGFKPLGDREFWKDHR